MRTSILMLGHGSRDAAANLEFEALVASYRRRRPELDVTVGYVELAAPSLDTALDAAAARSRRVVVVPLFLFAAGHVKNDLPLALDRARRAWPEAQLAAARPFGVHPSLAELLAERVATVAPQGAEERAKTAVLVVGRGASDPDANGDFCKLVRLYAEGRGFHSVQPTFIGITRPLVDDSLEQAARARPSRIVLAPYFLTGGRLVAKLEDRARAFRERYPWIHVDLAPHLGAGEPLLALLDERIDEALSGEARPLACDGCQYRVPLPGREQHVGGLRAMLYSLRHGFTHTQAAPHPHAHAPLAKHVLVCGNVDCAERGSIALVESLRRLIKDAGRAKDIKITKTSCMGRCGEGPTVVVYPDGIWYRNLRAGDAAELVDEHLIHDRLVARLVDNIMQ